MKKQKPNWFQTLNDALESENLLEAWNMCWSPLKYGESRSWVWEGKFITIYRETSGLYERPVHYSTLIKP